MNKILIALATALGIGIITTKANKSSAENVSTSNSVPTPNSVPKSNAVVKNTNAFPLTFGSKGSNVVLLQKYLNEYFALTKINTKISTDGIFGRGTGNAASMLFGGTDTTSKVSEKSFNWLRLSIESTKAAIALRTLTKYIGRTVKLKTNQTFFQWFAYKTSPLTGMFFKLANGTFVQPLKGFTKNFSFNKESFVVVYESELSVILDLGKIILPDQAQKGFINYATGKQDGIFTSQYFAAYKKDLTIVK